MTYPFANALTILWQTLISTSETRKKVLPMQSAHDFEYHRQQMLLELAAIVSPDFQLPTGTWIKRIHSDAISIATDTTPLIALRQAIKRYTENGRPKEKQFEITIQPKVAQPGSWLRL